MPVNYTITYLDDRHHDTCGASVSSLIFHVLIERFAGRPGLFGAIQDGQVEYDDGSSPLGPRPVDLLTLYFTPPASGWPAVPETFHLYLTYNNWYQVEQVYKDVSNNSPPTPVPVDDGRGAWIIPVSGPNLDDEVTNFQLATPGSAPPHKRKIRVMRQSSFVCGASSGYDDVWGGEFVNP